MSASVREELIGIVSRIVALLDREPIKFSKLLAEVTDVRDLCLREMLIMEADPNPNEYARLRKHTKLSEEDMRWLLEMRKARGGTIDSFIQEKEEAP